MIQCDWCGEEATENCDRCDDPFACPEHYEENGGCCDNCESGAVEEEQE